ncbi:hypothetical protein HanIR_Chr15g0750801 [Helianthus annuus]|nr:hypothetical protein HanIR_Chr15g0750801 [Helianthus annuus]
MGSGQNGSIKKWVVLVRVKTGSGQNGFRVGTGPGSGWLKMVSKEIVHQGAILFGSKRYVSKRFASKRFGSKRFASKRFASKRFASKRFVSKRYGSKWYWLKRYASKRLNFKPSLPLNLPIK